jgi:UDP-N-acetylmuramoylalanine-D-glutamate ligase
MKRLRLPLIALVSLLAAGAVVSGCGSSSAEPATDGQTPKQQGTALLTNFWTAVQDADTDTLDESLSPSWQLARADGTYLSRKAYIAEVGEGQIDITDFEFDDVTATRSGQSLVVRYVTTADYTLEGDTIMHHGRPLLAMAETRLRGPHNAENLMAAFGAAECLGADAAKMVAAARGYAPPPHRCEFVRELDGVTWINDSKSTNLDALAQALRGQTGGVVLIAGGKNKGFDFAPVAGLVAERVREAVLIGEMREAIAADWSVPSHPVASLEEAVSLAHRLSRWGDTVLFSPGTSSFDMFRSYEERGDLFKNLTHQLKPKEKNT